MILLDRYRPDKPSSGPGAVIFFCGIQRPGSACSLAALDPRPLIILRIDSAYNRAHIALGRDLDSRQSRHHQQTYPLLGSCHHRFASTASACPAARPQQRADRSGALSVRNVFSPSRHHIQLRGDNKQFVSPSVLHQTHYLPTPPHCLLSFLDRISRK